MVDLSVQLGPLRLAHPVINASGTMEIFELAESIAPDVVQPSRLAAYVPKTITLDPRPGNRPPRILETPGGVINAIGLPGPGLDAFIRDELSRLLVLPCPLVLSIGGFSTNDYVTLAVGLRDALDELVGQGDGGGWRARVGLELNISCPNVHSGCASIGSDPTETSAVVSAVRAVWPGLLVVKLTPNVTDITVIGRAAEEAGADAIAAVNTYKGLVVDRATLRPYLGNVTGGLSGPAIKPLALRAVFELFGILRLPIVGMGGVASVQDVLEFMACGASVVAVGSSAFRDPCFIEHLVHDLPRALEDRGLTLDTLLGKAHHDR